MSGIMPASKMGFGCMRLPLLDPNDQTSIDLPQFKQMVDVFMEAGNTYFDTAFVYHEGASETALGEALGRSLPTRFLHRCHEMPCLGAPQQRSGLQLP